ncbi:hypothetical protein V3C99_009259 [Haemonchus contortus]|uniref:Transmembrane protein 65 n=1 Tax=Haemonchus contortus TaxID=6289 RepID=A0A7I4YK24_HAECO|nr:Transmembrane protein 65 domain containing protein [Haemonchus contortus]
MRILTSYARLVSCIGSTRGCKFNVSSALKECRTSTGKWHASTRRTTTGAVHVLEKSTIDDHDTALEVAARFSREEQLLLRKALEDLVARTDVRSPPISDDQIRALFLVNALPFIGFGFLDNMIMIVAGNYIDQGLGTLLCLSTMAAAGFGNLISDVAGVGLAHYVESVFHKLGVRHPVLTTEQLCSSRARWTTNAARAFGLSIGCIIGMFPLLFFDPDGSENARNKSETSPNT